MSYCYILHSTKLNKFYTGACNGSLESRIEKHNNHSYGNHRYTAAATDWELYLSIETTDYAHSIRLEKKIKSMKSSKYIENLKKYPDLVQKIYNETKKE
jgi:putative endonuclease